MGAALSPRRSTAAISIPVRQLKTVFLVMEYVDGCNLREWLAQARPTEQILDAFAQAGLEDEATRPVSRSEYCRRAPEVY